MLVDMQIGDYAAGTMYRALYGLRPAPTPRRKWIRLILTSAGLREGVEASVIVIGWPHAARHHRSFPVRQFPVQYWASARIVTALFSSLSLTMTIYSFTDNRHRRAKRYSTGSAPLSST